MNTGAADLSFSSEMRVRFLRNVLALGGSQVAGGILSVWIVTLSTRILGSAGYGGYSTFLMISSFTSACGVNWLFNGIYKAAADERSSGRPAGAALGSGLVMIAGSLGVQSVLFFALYHWLSNWLDLPSDYFAVIPVYVGVSCAVTVANYTFQAMGDFSRYAFLPNLERLFFLAILVLAVRHWESVSASTFVCWLILSQALLAIFAFSQLDWRRIGRLSWNAVDARRIFNFSIPYLLTNASVTFGGWFDIYVVRNKMSSGDLGVYFLAVQFYTVSAQIIFLLNSVLTQMFIALRNEARSDSIRSFFDFHAPVVLSGGAVLLLSGAEVLRALFPYAFRPAFAGSLPLMIELTVALHAAFVFVIYHPVLFSNSRTGRIAVLTLLPAALTVPFAPVLIGLFGLQGAAVVRIVSADFGALLAVFLSRGQGAGSSRLILSVFFLGQVLLFGSAFSPSLAWRAAIMLIAAAAFWFFYWRYVSRDRIRQRESSLPQSSVC